jgi:hypothetical protein
MGNGTWSLTGVNGIAWVMATITNLTWNANGSTISFPSTAITQPAARTFTGGALSYNIISVGATTSGLTQFQSASTFATLNITAPTTVSFQSSTTLTITNAINWSGSSSNQIGLFSSAAAQATISSANNATMSWVGIYNIKFQGGGTFTATNSMDMYNNTNVTVTPPAAFSSGGGRTCILGGWLLWRDLPEHINDNFPAWIEKAA